MMIEISLKIAMHVAKMSRRQWLGALRFPRLSGKGAAYKRVARRKTELMAVYLHEEDLPADVLAPGPVAVDTETMGLLPGRDRLCLVQISDGGGDEHLVRRT